MVLAEEAIAALVEVEVTTENILAAAGRLVVDNFGGGHEPALIAGCREAIAQLHFLGVHEETLVEGADFIECGASNQQAGADEPINLLWLGVRAVAAIKSAQGGQPP